MRWMIPPCESYTSRIKSGDLEGELMKIVVFGASGNCGAHFVKLAAARGHQITAVVREGTAYEAPAGVTVVRGDVLDAPFVASVIRGHDAVMSGLGMRYKHPWARRESPDDFTWRATENIIGAMKRHGLRRISIVSAAGVGESRPILNWAMRLLLKHSNVGVAYAALDRAEELLAASGLDWQAVRPTTLTHGKRTDSARITAAYPMTANIS